MACWILDVSGCELEELPSTESSEPPTGTSVAWREAQVADGSGGSLTVPHCVATG